MKTIRILFLFLFCSLMPLGLMAEQVKVAFSAGKSQYLKPGADAWQNVKRGTVLELADQIRTFKGAVVLLEGQGFKIRLSPETDLTLASLFPKAQINLSGGKAWVQVDRLKDGQSFQMRSPSSVVGVRGTEFIYAVGEQDELLVIEGKVAFGSDFDTALELTRGQAGSFRESLPMMRPAGEEDFKKFKAEFEFKSEEDADTQKKHLERAIFRSEMRQETDRIRQVKESGQSRLREDLMTGRTVTDKEGNVVRVEQILRRNGESGVEIINITSKTNFMNVVQYTGVYEGSLPSTFADLFNIDKTQNREISKTISIVQNDRGYIDRMKIVEDKSEAIPTFKVGINGSGGPGSFDNPNDVADYTKLKQREDNAYLSSQYQLDPVNFLNLRVYLLDKDGRVVSAAAGGADNLSMDFLSTMSFQFVFTGSGFSFESGNGITFNILPDIGFLLMNDLVQ